MKKVSMFAILPSCLLAFCSGCDNPLDHKYTSYKYTIKENTDLSDLLVFYYGPSIFGIDTTDFSVKGHIRIDDMSIGGVAKLPSGGVAFTHHRRASNNAWGNTLYVTDKDCNLLNTYEICWSPMAPNVINKSLLIGSTAIEQPGTKFVFQIYDTDNFNLKKEYMFEDMVDAWQITCYNKNAYFGIGPGYASGSSQYGYVIELNLDTFDTTIINAETDFFLNAHPTALRQDSLLYILNILEKNICIYSFQSKSITFTKEVSKIPIIADMQATRVTHPSIYNGYLYCKFELNTSYGNVISYLVKLNPNTLEYVSHKQLDTPMGMTVGSFHFYVGHYFVMQFLREKELQIIFYNRETGNIEHNITLPGSKYDYR
jgi:hypothetical protein